MLTLIHFVYFFFSYVEIYMSEFLKTIFLPSPAQSHRNFWFASITIDYFVFLFLKISKFKVNILSKACGTRLSQILNSGSSWFCWHVYVVCFFYFETNYKFRVKTVSKACGTRLSQILNSYSSWISLSLMFFTESVQMTVWEVGRETCRKT